MKEKKQRKKSIFLPVLTGFVILSIVGIICSFIRLWHYLEDYQNTLPSQIGDTVLHAYQSCDTPTLRSLCKDLPSSLQDDFTYQSYLHQHINTNDLYYYESDRDDAQGIITYSYQSEGKTFATLTVCKTDVISHYGFPLYRADSLVQNAMCDYEFHEAAGTTFLIDGAPIDASYLTNSNVVATTFEELGIGPFYEKEYTVPDTKALGNITAVLEDGYSCGISWDESHTICSSLQNQTDLTDSPAAEFAMQSAKTYATFATIKNASREPVLSCLYTDSNFYQAIKTYDNAWGIASTSASFSNEKVNQCITYSPDAITCDVSFDYTVTQGAHEKVFSLHFLCYVVKKEDTYKILNIETM